MLRIATLSVCLLVLAACETAPDSDASKTSPSGASTAAQANQAAPAPEASAEFPTDARRPRWSRDGKRLVFYAGKKGSRSIYLHVDGKISKVGLPKGDFVDPDFARDDARIVVAGNIPGTTRGFDLFLFDLESSKFERLTESAGDEREPTVNPLLFGFYAVENGICGSEASGTPIDGYEKLIYLDRNSRGETSVRYTSVKPRVTEGLYPDGDFFPEKLRKQSEHGAHSGLFFEGNDCHSLRFSDDGLSAVATCGDGKKSSVRDTRLTFDADFETAIKTAGAEETCPVFWSEISDWTDSECLERLPRRYSSVETERRFAVDTESVAYSANQIEIVAAIGGSARGARRTNGSAFEPLDIEEAPEKITDVVWSPDGSSVALEHAAGASTTITVLPVNAYLQDVKNLDDFPELWKNAESKLLDENGFVARPSPEKEYYPAYEKLRYAERPIFVTADAALQVFRDEFQIVLQKAEERAAEDVHIIASALMNHYAEKNDPESRYLAIYFATAWVPLESARGLEKPTFDDIMARGRWDDEEPKNAEVFAPAIERIPGQKKRVLAKVPASIRSEVRKNVEKIYAAGSTGKLSVPGFPKPVNIDYTQFRPRGSYAQSDLAGYFYTMSWFAQAPLPMERAPLDDLLDTMKTMEIAGEKLWERWKRTDALVGAFMGKPGAATPSHVDTLRASKTDLWKTFDRKKVVDELEELRGPVPLRDLDAALSGEGKAALKIMLFPKRVGLDTTFFRSLVAPDVPDRFTPSALEPFAILGSKAATKHIVADAREEPYFEAYKKALDELDKKHGELATTDLYHAWMAVLATLATSEVGKDSVLEYARSEAWADRTLHSALAGYTQLKHAATLYNMQDMGVECDGAQSVHLLTERPIIPKPRGSVDPMPEFFEQLSKLADRVYDEMSPDGPPSVDFWQAEADEINAQLFVDDLASLARKVADGEELSNEEYAWIRSVGGRMEALLLRTADTNYGVSASTRDRLERGVAIATDVHTLVQSQRVLQLAIGRLLAMWVAVPNDVGSRLTQGYIASWYSFLHPMSDRLTDSKWNSMIESGELPERPGFTASFIEERPAEPVAKDAAPEDDADVERPEADPR